MRSVEFVIAVIWTKFKPRIGGEQEGGGRRGEKRGFCILFSISRQKRDSPILFEQEQPSSWAVAIEYGQPNLFLGQ